MQSMLVSPLFKVSPDGPVSRISHDLVHLRQGQLDGACGPYCIVSALITLGLMGRADVLNNMHLWKGSTREGRFRDALYDFGALSNKGTTSEDLLWLTDFFKRKKLLAVSAEGSKRVVFDEVVAALPFDELPIVGVSWAGGSGHWMLVVGCQGEEAGEDFQLTHLLCLDPGQEAPKASLWNAVIEVYKADGSSVNRGRFSSNFWGMDGVATKCQVEDSVVLLLDSKG